MLCNPSNPAPAARKFRDRNESITRTAPPKGSSSRSGVAETATKRAEGPRRIKKWTQYNAVRGGRDGGGSVTDDKSVARARPVARGGKLNYERDSRCVAYLVLSFSFPIYCALASHCRRGPEGACDCRSPSIGEQLPARRSPSCARRTHTHARKRREEIETQPRGRKRQRHASANGFGVLKSLRIDSFFSSRGGLHTARLYTPKATRRNAQRGWKMTRVACMIMPKVCRS